MKTQKFLHLRQDSVTVKEFSTRFNSLAKYVVGVDSLDRGKLEIFLKRFKLDILKDVLMGDNHSRFLSKTLR